MDERPRWMATITHRSENGPLDVIVEIEELDELADMVENGPHWDTIIRIEVILARPAENPDMTIEIAAHGGTGIQ